MTKSKAPLIIDIICPVCKNAEPIEAILGKIHEHNCSCKILGYMYLVTPHIVRIDNSESVDQYYKKRKTIITYHS